MKTSLLVASLLVLFSLNALAQTPEPRRIAIPNFGRDSLHIPLNEEYRLIEDSCAYMVRHVRFDKTRKVFYGNFTDRSRTNPDLILSQGSYTTDGLKSGPFTLYYANGKLRAQGAYKDNEFEGIWHLFYESGLPKLAFSATNGQISIVDAWDTDGKQTVSNGTGKYVIKGGFVTWSGELKNSKPEGTWQAVNTTDRSRTPVSTEKFKDGEFKRGTSPIGPYTDSSRILWVDMNDFPYTYAESMAISQYTCNNRPKGVHVVGAQYINGLPAFSEEIKRHVSNYLSTVDLKPYDSDLTIQAEVSENGKLTNLKYGAAFNQEIARGLVKALGRLPLLEPALLDGKPVKQPFEIKFRFHAGVYQFNYRFLPIPKNN